MSSTFTRHVCVVTIFLVGIEIPENVSVGLVYLDGEQIQLICNTVFLREKWSLAPGHCVSMRSDPDMAQYLKIWRIRYRTMDSHVVSEIKRSIPHPHFNRDDFSNNIGIFEHKISILNVPAYSFPVNKQPNDVPFENNNLVLYGWSPREDNTVKIMQYNLRHVPLKECLPIILPIVNLRSYEICVMLEKGEDSDPDHGAALSTGTHVVAFFAWGERHFKGFPSVFIEISHFKEWLQNVISL